MKPESKNKSTYMQSSDLQQRCQDYTMGKRQSLPEKKGMGETGHPHVKEWDSTLSYNIYKNWLKMDSRQT